MTRTYNCKACPFKAQCMYAALNAMYKINVCPYYWEDVAMPVDRPDYPADIIELAKRKHGKRKGILDLNHEHKTELGRITFN